MDDSNFDGNPELGSSAGTPASAPDNPVRQSERGSMTPSFLHTPSKAENDAARPAHLGPAANLKKSEADAVKNGDKAGDKAGAKAAGKEGEKAGNATGAAKLAEKMGAANPIGFLNKVTGKNKDKGKGKGAIKKKVATAAIITSLLGGGVGFSFFGQMMQPFALVNNLIQNFNVSSYSTHARLRTTLRSMLKKSTKPSQEVKANLKQTGVEVETDEDGNVKGYKYEGQDGEVKNIKTVEELNDVMNNDEVFNSKVAKSSEIVDTQSLYGDVKTTAAERINWEKNRFEDYDSEDADAKSKTDGTFETIAAGEENSPTSKTVHFYDENGNEIDEKTYNICKSAGCTMSDDVEAKVKTDADVEEKIGDVAKVKEDGEVEIDSKINGAVDSVTSKMTGAAKVISGTACAVTGVAQAVAAVTIAKQIINMVNLASGFLESTQKCQAGEGTCQSMHDYQNRMNSGDFWSATSIQSVFGSDSAKSQSSGMANLEGVFNDSSLKGMLISYGISKTSLRVCTYTKIAANGIDLVKDIADTVATLGTGGLWYIFKMGIKAVGISSAISALIIAPFIKGVTEWAKGLFKLDVITDMGKAVAGDYTVGGSKKILYTMGQSTGLTNGTEEAVARFEGYKDTVIAQRAKYDRDNLSPFDTSSQYTFLGSILNSLASFSVINSAGSNQLTGIIGGVSSVVAGSLVGMMPQTAASAYYNIANESGDCPIVNSIDAVGDANHCFANTISDTATFNISYEEARDYLKGEKMLECDGDKCNIPDDNNDLAKYIKYRTQRDVQPGLVDAAVQNDLHVFDDGSSGFINIGSIPIIGSAGDLADAVIDEENLGVITGADYVIGTDAWTKKEQYMHAYIDLDPLYNQLGLIENSAVADFLDDYYQKNPLDNSYEGLLARYSGLTKDEVEATLAYIDYEEAVTAYRPAEKYAFADNGEQKLIINGKANREMTGIEYIATTYYDLRNRALVL